MASMVLRELLAKASPARSGDELAGLEAQSAEERVRAQMKLADVPLKTFLREPVIPYEEDEVTRLICDSHDGVAFAPVAHLTVGEFRDWLLYEQATTERLSALAPGLTPEMAAAVSKIMRLQDLVTVAAKIRVVTRFRDHRAWPAGCQRGCSRIIPPTIRRASRPASSMACCMAAGTR